MKALCAKTHGIISYSEHKVFGVPALAGRAHPPPEGGTPCLYSRSSLRSWSLFCLWQNLLLFLAAFVTFSATAQIQQAWVAHYNNGITNGTNQALKMALDSAGNIYVTGFSQNANSQLGYVTIKYAPNGSQLWATRYDSTTYPTATPAAMVLDGSNDVVVTGSALTIKYDPNGNQLWTAPYGGTALACDGLGNVYVAGFGTNFNTVKLAVSGTNLWLTTYNDVGPTVSQSVLVDNENNVYVSGLDSYMWVQTSEANPQQGYYAVVLTTIKYASNGNQIWASSQSPPFGAEIGGVQVTGAALDGATNLYLLGNFSGGIAQPYVIFKYVNNGTLAWTVVANRYISSSSTALALDGANDVLVTGKVPYYAGFSYLTYKITSYGSAVWTNFYPQTSSGTSVSTSLAGDFANNSYVTGYSPGTNSLNDIVTIKYGPNGNQVWLQRYNGPGKGNDAGNAIAVDNNGNVYVAGYDTTTAGGTEMVLIKYSPITLKKQANGSILLQAQGYAGESFDIQASADLLHWLDLGIVTADTNGLMQFDDTTAPNYPARFYYTNPQ